jgi:DNA topoisomerase-1
MNADLRLAGLERATPTQLKIRRVRRGNGFVYVKPNGQALRDLQVIRRLTRLAVPPAYRDAVFASNPRAHIQAMGRDAAGRLQYRYHPDWERVRELRKARRLAKLVQLLPRIRRTIAKLLRERKLTRAFALAAVVDLIADTAIRSGSEAYAKTYGTRGAATLLKKNALLAGDKITLRFRGKGGKQVEKQFQSRRLAKAIKRLRQLPGQRLFQYVSDTGETVPVRRRDANVFIREITGDKISLKDFRTLSACAHALEKLLQVHPKPSQRGRRSQLNAVLREVANELANTPAVCRRSYVHAVVIDAFEDGRLKKLSSRSSSQKRHSAGNGERLLEKILQNAAALQL